MVSAMAGQSSIIKNSASDELRLRNHRTMMEQRHEAEIRDLERKQRDQIENLMIVQENQKEQIKHAFEVEISREAESLSDRLDEVRRNSAERVDLEKKAGDTEVEKLRRANRDRIDEYKRNADSQISQIRKETQMAQADLQAKARHALKKQKELSES